MYDLLLICHSK